MKNKKITFNGGQMIFREEGSFLGRDGKPVELEKAVILTVGRQTLSLNGSAIRAIQTLGQIGTDADIQHFIDTLE